jgi:flotillin
VSEPLSKTDKMVIVNTGNGAGGGASKLTGEVSQILSQLPPVIEGLTGIKLEDLLKRVPSLKPVLPAEKAIEPKIDRS